MIRDELDMKFKTHKDKIDDHIISSVLPDTNKLNILTVILAWTCFVICNFTMLKLKPCFLIKQNGGDDVGYPSVYILLLMVDE